MSTVNGTSGYDNLSGTPGADAIYGFGQDDTLTGAEGDDTLDGGNGSDTAYFANYASGYGDVTINLLTGTASGPDSGYDTLISIERVDSRGNCDTTIIGDENDNALLSSTSLSNVILAGGGDDIVTDFSRTGSTLDGGSGHNALVLTRITFVPFIVPFTGAFTPGVSDVLADGTTYSNFEYLYLGTGSADDAFTFNQPKPMMSSNAGFLSNGWDAGDGNDTVTVDLSGYSTPLKMDAPDIFARGQAYARIQKSSTNTDILILTRVENYIIAGGSGGDNFAGGSGKDVFTGGAGQDTLAGGRGMDTARYSGLAANYQVVQLSGNSFQIKDLRTGSPDGTDLLSDMERLQWSDGSFTTLLDTPPELTTSDSVVSANQTLTLSSLIGVTDYENDPITKYQLWDSTRDPASGHFVVNGVTQAAGTVINVTAAQLTQTSFVTGTAADDLQIRAFDGLGWSAADTEAWSPFTISPPVNQPPVVTVGDITSPPFQIVGLSFGAQDFDNDPITKYQILDSTTDPFSGHLVVNHVAQTAGIVIELTPAQMAQTTFVTGTVADTIHLRAFDGTDWSSDWSGSDERFYFSYFKISPPRNHPPVVTAGNNIASTGQTLALSSLFSVSDVENDPITQYQLWDSTRDPNSGYFVVNGAVQAAGTIIDITATELAQTSFVAGRVNDSLQIRAFDGADWSAANNASWAPFTVTVPANTAPAVTANNVTKPHLQTYLLSSLFSATDADGDGIVKYQLWDSTRDPNSGHFAVGGASLGAGTVIDITAAQLAQTSFVTGTVSDSLQIRAFDGLSWSAADNAFWSPFTVSVPANTVPMVTTGTANAQHGRSLALSSLFQANDADGDTITKYQLWDSARDPNSGHFMIGGTAQAAGTVIEITAAQLAQTSFVTGAVSDSLQIRAFDGIDWSAGDNAPWSPFTVSVTPYTAPALTTQDINTTAGQSLALSSLFQVSDVDGDSMTRYQLWDSSRDPNSGSFVVGGVAKAPGMVIDITAADLAQTSFLTGTVGDSLQIRAFDGFSWSASDTASWAPFHINVS